MNFSMSIFQSFWRVSQLAALWVVLIFCAPAQAQYITSQTASPSNFSGSGQTITFTVAINTDNSEVKAVSVSKGVGPMLSCSPTSADLNSTITCTGTYITAAGDTSVTAAGTITLTTGSSVTLNYNVSAADPSPNTPYFSSGSAPTTAAEGSSVSLALVTPSGMTPSLASNTSSVCTASGLTLNMVGVGTCNAVATGPASSPFYTEGTLNISISVTDTEPPVITAPGAQSASTDAGTNTATLDVTSLGSVTDNSGTTPAITYAIGGTPLSGLHAFPMGVTTVTMDAADGAGNAAVQQSFTVTVTDGEVPVITAPGAQSASTDAGANTAMLDVTSLGSVTDNSGTTPTITYAIGGTPLSGAHAFPIGVTTVTMDATDSAGNAATQVSFTVTITDNEAPTVTLTTNSTQVAAGDRVVVNIAFSEPVTGFHGSELNLGNATLTSLSGTGTAWVATLSAIGGGDVTVSVPAGAATDAAGNGNEMSNTLSVRDTTITETQTQISQFMQSRVDLLLKNQPELAHLLLGSETGRLNSQVSRGTGTFNFANRSDAPVWMMLNGSWTNESDRDLTYLFGSIGRHIKVNPNLLVGGMLQFDHMDQTDGAAKVQGTGWLAGPYFVARLPEKDLYFDGRLLYGQSSNKITPFGTYTDKFDTNRLLASLQVSGVLDYGEVDIIPSLKASYAREAQSAYTDTPGNRIPKQTVELGQIEAGLAFVAPMPLYTGEGEMTLTGGVKAIGSFVNGSGHAASVSPDYEGGRARIDLGMMHRMVNGGQFQIQSYYDGIGASGYDSYGISFSLEYQF